MSYKVTINNKTLELPKCTLAIEEMVEKIRDTEKEVGKSTARKRTLVEQMLEFVCMCIGEEQAKEKAAQLAKKQEEHLKKKKQWQKEKARRKAENAPEVIHVSGNVKFSEFTETDEKAVNDEMSADDEKPVEEAQEKIAESEDTKN